jgi:hypothetical protein
MTECFRRTRLVGIVLAVGIVPRAASGELIRLHVLLESRTQEFIAGEPVSSDNATPVPVDDPTSRDFPVQVTSHLERPTVTGELVAAAQGFADVNEPDLAADANPEELGLEADAFSIDPEIAYQVTASAVETRTILLTPGELGSGPGVEREVESRVFLSGAILVWSLEEGRDLTGLSAEVRFTIDQIRDGDADGVNVFSASMGVRGLPDGEVEAVSEGVATFEFGGPETILNPDEPDPQLEEYLGILGSTHVMLIPDQEIAYTYQAEAGEEFDLRATFEVELVNLPDGTGVSAVFGREFEALADMINEAIPEVDGGAVEAGVNLAQASATVPPATGGRSSRSSGTLCGALGFEALGMLLFAAAVPLTARRRRARMLFG